MSLEDKNNEQRHSDDSPLLRTQSTPEICPKEDTSLKRNLIVARQCTFGQSGNRAVFNTNKKICDIDESLPDISAMSLASLYQKQHNLEDMMDTDK